MAKELWASIPGYEGYYEVSDKGRIRSVAREVSVAPSIKAPSGYIRSVKSRHLVQILTTDGYWSASLWKEHDLRVVRAHILVLEAFVGGRPDGCYACHKNDVKTDNRLENLYWGTPQENQRDKERNGNQPYGEACYQAILSDDDVRSIRGLSKEISQSVIAERFGVQQPHVSRIIRGSRRASAGGAST